MMLSKEQVAMPAEEAFAGFQNVKQVWDAKLLCFFGAEGYDVYNPSMPFFSDGREWIAGRVESRGGHDSRVLFFEKQPDGYHYCSAQRSFALEDPFITTIGGELVFGGVHVVWEDGKPRFKTMFYRGTSIAGLTEFAQGPENMKDIRLCELPDGRIGVLTRPRGIPMLAEHGSLGVIGFTVIARLEDLTAQAIQQAPLLRGQFVGVEWGGANQAFPLKNGLVGIIGHRSWGSFTSITDCDLHYYGIAFAVHPDTLETTETKIILSRDCFPSAPAKMDGVADVTFPAGAVRNSDGTATVYAGLSDAAVGIARIPDPFLQWEDIALA